MSTLENPRDIVLTVYLGDRENGGGYALHLPAEDARLETAKQALGVRDLADIPIQKLDWADHEFEGYDGLDGPSVAVLNRLARVLHDSVTTPAEKQKLLAACEALDAGSWEELLEIAGNLDDFELFRVSDPSEFGEDKMQENGIRETNYGYIARLSEPLPEEQGFSQSFQ